MEWDEIMGKNNKIDCIFFIFYIQDKVDWKCLSMNPSIFEFHQEKSIERTNIIREELLQKVLHPKRLQRMMELLGDEFDANVNL